MRIVWLAAAVILWLCIGLFTSRDSLNDELDASGMELVVADTQTVTAPKIARGGSEGQTVQEITPKRTRRGLRALYEFNETEGEVIHDRSGIGDSLDLRFENTPGVRFENGGLVIETGTQLQSAEPARKIIDAVRNSGEISIEAWITPVSKDLSGPARIVSISKDSSNRNITLGQDGGRFDVRMRTTETSTNGLPSLPSDEGSLETELTHIVYTRDRGGTARVFLNGELNHEQSVQGITNNWDREMRLALGDEFGGGRSWLGTYHLVAIYSRDLVPREVFQNFLAGPNGETPEPSAGENALTESQTLFQKDVARILVDRCFECHDSATREGGLDLSRRTDAMAGGDGGEVIIPKDPSDSTLWHSIESDDMPMEREPLSDAEKTAIKQWIESGAEWSFEEIDPGFYQLEQEVSQSFVRRLTLGEYVKTVYATTGVDIEDDARRLLPPDLRADGFSNTAYNLNVDLKHISAYAELASIIVSQMDVLAFASEFGDADGFDDARLEPMVNEMGRWLLRGPLEPRELNSYLAIAEEVNELDGTFTEGVSFIVEAMLQAPRFVYRMENQLGDGTPWPVNDYELASRLSYSLWGGPPDRELMDAAELGELFDSDRVANHVNRMLQDPQAAEHAARFITEWLHLDRLENLRPNAEHFPSWDHALANDMRRETLAFFHEVVWEEKRPLADLLNAPYTFVTPRLANHYRMSLQVGADSPDEMIRVDLSSEPGRGGLLTHGSVLTVGGDDASMVTRGLFVLHDVLRGVVKDPPPCVDTTPVPTKPGLTRRDVAEGRIANVSCGGCHSKFEPFAFGLEKFDGLGTYSDEDEHGNRLREDGELLFPGMGESVSYESTAELMDLLAEHERVSRTIIYKLAQFVLGRPLVPEDAAVLQDVYNQAMANGGTYEAAMTAIVMSDLVQTTRTENEP